MTTAISLVNLVKRFPRTAGYRQLLPWHRREEVTAVDGVSLQVAEGELFGLLGPNGAGKTTLMKILSTVVLPTSGQVVVFGNDVVSADAKVRGLVGLVTADERSFYWRLTGRQNLEFFAALYRLCGRAGRRRVAELLDLLGLADAADQRFQSYSSGMRQKMAIARGLLPNPRVLLMDEPTRSLDPLSAQAVRTFLKERVARTGCTVVLATHQMAEAEQLCDRVAILHRGGVLAFGTVEELRLAHRRDRCHLEVSDLGSDRWRWLARMPGVTDFRMARQRSGAVGLEVGLADARTVLPRLIEEIVTSGGKIYGCNVRERPLEEIFVDLVQEASTAGVGAEVPEPIQTGVA